MKDIEQFWELVEIKRKMKGWNKTQLYNESNISQPSITRIEKGDQTNLKIDTIQKLAKSLEISVVCVAYAIDQLLCDHILDLENIDKLTILRFIYRLCNGAEETDKLMKETLKAIQNSPETSATE